MDSIDSPYFRFVIDRIQAWKSEKPSILSLGVNKALGPLNWAVRAIVPQRAIQAVLDGGDWLAQKTIRDSHVSTPDATLQDCDVAAGKARSWAIGYAVAEGTAAGAVGILSTPVDIPATIMLSLRTIRRIGACYGFAEGGEAERSFVMGILASAGASSVEERLAASLALREIQTILVQKTFQEMASRASTAMISREAGILAVRNLARQLGVNLTKRRMLAAVPLIGAAIGGSMNGWFLGDVATAATHAYQERWLRTHGLMIEGEVKQAVLL